MFIKSLKLEKNMQQKFRATIHQSVQFDKYCQIGDSDSGLGFCRCCLPKKKKNKQWKNLCEYSQFFFWHFLCNGMVCSKNWVIFFLKLPLAFKSITFSKPIFYINFCRDAIVYCLNVICYLKCLTKNKNRIVIKHYFLIGKFYYSIWVSIWNTL